MSAKELIKPVSKLLISEFGKRGISLKPSISYQLISAAFGFWSHESTTEYEVPFEPYNERHYFGAKPQFHQGLLCERISGLLSLDEDKSRYLSQLIVDLLTHHLPIRVQALRVLYDADYSATRPMIFRIINQGTDEMSPLASAAIALNKLPALPAMTIAGHLRLMRSQPMINQEKEITVDEFVSQAPTWIWCYPSAFVKEAFPSLADSAFRKKREEDAWGVSDIKPQTEIGVGFVLLQKQPDDHDCPVYSVVSGRYVLGAEGASSAWSTVKILSQSRTDVQSFRQKPLPEILGHSVDQLPLLTHCSVCGGLQAIAPGEAIVVPCDCTAV